MNQLVMAVDLPVENFRGKIEATEDFMSELPQIHVEPVHRFAEGLYCRQLTMPADTVWVSRVHKHENFAFIMTGECTVVSEHGAVRVRAPHMFKTLAGTKRLLQIHEESTWITVHAMPEGMTEFTPVDDIEDYYACNTLEDYDKYLIQEMLKLEVPK